MLELKNVSIAYEEPLLTDINLQFKAGEITVVSGASGSGKSSFLKVLNGIIPEFHHAQISGTITYQEKDLLPLNMSERSLFLSTVFQNPKTQFYSVNSTDEMAFALENRCLPREEILSRITKYTKLLGMEDLLDRDIFTLSGGEKQLLAITSVACMDNDIYMFDEPSSSLDPDAILRLKEVLLTLKKLGKTIIIAEHRLHYLKDIMDRFVLFENKTATVYPTEILDEIFTQKHQLRSLTAIPKENLKNNPYQIKNLLDQSYDSEKELVCQNYTYAYDKFSLFDMNVSFGKGIYFIIGRNGIGKTTFLRCLSGLVKKFKGKTFYSKKKVQPPYNFISNIMQDVNYQLFTESVWSEISIVSQKDEAKSLALQQLELLDKKDRHPQSLSGGEKQRLLLAMAKISEKPIVILDEPTSGLCKGQMDQMVAILHQMAREGKTILVVTHDYELIQHCGGTIIEFIRK